LSNKLTTNNIVSSVGRPAENSMQVDQCRIKVGAIDAASLGPFVKYAHKVDEKFFL